MTPRPMPADLYAAGGAVFRQLYVPFATASVALAAAETVPAALGMDAQFAGIVVTVLVSTWLLLLSLSAIMPEAAPEAPLPYLRFLLRTLMISLILAGAGLPLAVLLPQPMSVLVILPFLFCGFAFLGSALPDVAAGGSGAISDAIERGKRTFGQTVRGMIRGPFAVTFASMLAVTVLTLPWGDPERIPLWYLAFLLIVSNLASCFGTSLLAIVLERSWRTGGGRQP